MLGGVFNDPMTAGPDYKNFTDDLPGHVRWLATKKAEMTGSRGKLDTLFSAAAQGITPDELDQQQHIADLEKKAMEIASKTAHLDDSEFNQILERMRVEGARAIDIPASRTPESPNTAQLGLAALGSLIDPSNASKIGATPFLSQMDAENKRFADSVARFRELKDQKAQNLDFLGSQLNIADRAAKERQRQEQERIGNELGLTKAQLEQAYAMRNTAQDFAQSKELLGMKGEQGETSAAYKAYYNAPDLTVRRKAWEFLANRGEFLPEPTEQTGKEVLTGAQIADTQSRTNERETLLPEKVAKVQAEVQRIIGGVQLDDARKQQILQRVQYYPLEFQNRAANILSQIEGRKNKALNPKEKAVNLSDLERLRKIVQDRIDIAGPLRQDPKDLAEMYRLNQMREEILNAKVYGDVGTVAPYDPLSGEIRSTNPGDPRALQDAANRSVERERKAKQGKKKVSTSEARKRFNY